MTRGIRQTIVVGATALVIGSGVAPAVATDTDRDDHRHAQHGVGRDRIELPDGFQPEGIATDGKHTAWFGSRADGDVYRADLRTGRGQVISQGPGTASLGLKLDDRGRLFVAGGAGGDVRVLDSRSGRLLASYPLVSGTAFINDVVLTDRAAYVTDSANAHLFEIPLGRDGRLPAADAVRRIPLTGQWQQNSGNNGNGITTTPDGKALLVVNSSNGVLYRVDPRTGVASTVDTGGYSLTNGDGLLREGSTLYVVQNRLDTVARLTLSSDGVRAALRAAITSDDFDVPTTIARAAGGLYLPNARFTTTPTIDTTYWVTRIDDRRKRG